MKCFTRLDCIKLTDIEKIILATIKGVCMDYYMQSQGDPIYKDFDFTKDITVKPLAPDNALTMFRIENTPNGIFEDVKRLIKPIIFTYMVQGGWDEATRTTTIILQRFEVRRETLNYYYPQGVK